MGLAAEQDAVARQYVTGFRHVLRVCARWFDNARPLDESIVTAHLRQMAFEPDSLIRRKCGLPTAVECQRRAAAVLAAGFPHSASGRRRFASLDRWLRADGNRRNPGTSADLVAAGLFAALRRRRLAAPFAWSRALAEHP
jgi:triphosphoribosyl-dephospho-CoA synthase